MGGGSRTVRGYITTDIFADALEADSQPLRPREGPQDVQTNTRQSTDIPHRCPHSHTLDTPATPLVVPLTEPPPDVVVLGLTEGWPRITVSRLRQRGAMQRAGPPGRGHKEHGAGSVSPSIGQSRQEGRPKPWLVPPPRRSSPTEPRMATRTATARGARQRRSPPPRGEARTSSSPRARRRAGPG